MFTSPSRRAGHRGREVPAPNFIPQSGTRVWARALAPGQGLQPGDAQRSDGTGYVAALSLESRWPDRPRGRDAKQKALREQHPTQPRLGNPICPESRTRSGRLCHGGKQLEGKHLSTARQLGSPFPLDAACLRWVSPHILGLEQPRTLELSRGAKDKWFNMC